MGRRPLAVVVAAGLGLAVLVARPTSASAHQSSFTYGEVVASPDGRRVDYRLDLRSTDLFEALGGHPGDDADDAAIAGGADRLYAYVEARVTLAAPGQACAVARAPLEIVRQAERFARLRLTLTCPAPIVRFELDYDLFYDLDPGHIGLLEVDGATLQLRAPDDNRLQWELGDAPPDGAAGFVASGVHHIASGRDHICFLIALLLVAPLRRGGGDVRRRSSRRVDSAGEDGVDPGGGRSSRRADSAGEDGVARRPLRAALRYTAGVVTAFTAAHSLTLIAAALGWFDLPSRLVESAIAASIAIVALEDLARPDPPRRALATFGFGLIHGLGFAAMLTPLLPPERVVLPLLAFNVGVELGQLAVVGLTLPVLVALAARLGVERYRRLVVRPLAAVLVAIATAWLIERAFEVALFGR